VDEQTKSFAQLLPLVRTSPLTTKDTKEHKGAALLSEGKIDSGAISPTLVSSEFLCVPSVVKRLVVAFSLRVDPHASAVAFPLCSFVPFVVKRF
jgi:hypothetical protein